MLTIQMPPGFLATRSSHAPKKEKESLETCNHESLTLLCYAFGYDLLLGRRIIARLRGRYESKPIIVSAEHCTGVS